MRLRTTPLFGLLALFTAAAAWKHATDAQLRTALESSGYTLVAFVLPDEDSSQALEREWTAVQKTPEGDNILSFDCSCNEATCRELDALSYPAIRLYHRDGRIDRFRGERKSDQIVAFLRRSFRPAVFEVTESSLDGFMAIDDVVVVGYLDPDNDQLYLRYRRLAKQYRDRYSFGIASSGRGNPSVVRCHNNVDGEQHELAEPAMSSAMGVLEYFVKQCALPLVPERSRRNEAFLSTTLDGYGQVLIVQTDKSILHYLTSTDKDKDAFRTAIRPLAKQYKKSVQFVITDLSEYPGMLATLGLCPEATAGLALENTTSGQIFPYRGSKITAAIVESFLNDIVKGKVKSLTGDNQPKGDHDEL